MEKKPETILLRMGDALGMSPGEYVVVEYDPNLNAWDNLIRKLEIWLSAAKECSRQARKEGQHD